MPGTPKPTSADLASQRLVEVFSSLGRELLAADLPTNAALGRLAHRATELIAAADWASITTLRSDLGFETVAATDQRAIDLDKVQYEVGHGPCVDAIRAGETGIYRSTDLPSDSRWPEFGRRAGEAGVHSLTSVRFFLEDDDVIAGLNMYAAAPDAFDESDEAMVTLLATHGALAVSAAHRQDKVVNLNRALASNRRIGIATGILMASTKVTDEQAFDLLRVASQGTHNKLVDVAESVIETGMITLPAFSD